MASEIFRPVRTENLPDVDGYLRCHGLVPLVSTQVFKPMFSQLCRPLCGRSLTFREWRGFSWGCAPPSWREYDLPKLGLAKVGQASTSQAAKPRGAQPLKDRSILAEGRRPSAHQAAKPRGRPEKNLCRYQWNKPAARPAARVEFFGGRAESRERLAAVPACKCFGLLLRPPQSHRLVPTAARQRSAIGREGD